MTKILLGITIVFSLASAGLAFLTRQKTGELSATLSAAKQTSELGRAELERLKKEREETVAKLEQAEKTAEEQKGQLEKSVGDMKTLEAKGTAALSDMAKKEEQIADLNKKLKEAMSAAAAPPVPAGPDPAQEQLINTLKADLDKARRTAEAEQKRLAQKVQELEAKTAKASPKATTVVTDPATGRTVIVPNAPVSGQIVAMNEGWNFVVVSLGDKKGVTPESQLTVQRAGKTIAKLQITEVRPTHTSAGIVFPDPKKREAIQLGDKVFLTPKSDPSDEMSSASSPSPLIPVLAPFKKNESPAYP